jgi:hypothetical protein
MHRLIIHARYSHSSNSIDAHIEKCTCSLTASTMFNIIMCACAFGNECHIGANYLCVLVWCERHTNLHANMISASVREFHTKHYVRVLILHECHMQSSYSTDVFTRLCGCRLQFNYAVTANLFKQCRRLTRLQFVARRACFMYNYAHLHSHLHIILHIGFNLPTNGLSHSAHERECIVPCRALMSRRAFRRYEALTECNGYRAMWSWPSRSPGGVTRILITCNNT